MAGTGAGTQIIAVCPIHRQRHHFVHAAAMAADITHFQGLMYFEERAAKLTRLSGRGNPARR
jgi:hypothetical protein